MIQEPCKEARLWLMQMGRRGVRFSDFPEVSLPTCDITKKVPICDRGLVILWLGGT